MGCRMCIPPASSQSAPCRCTYDYSVISGIRRHASTHVQYHNINGSQAQSQITGLATFTNFVGMGIGALDFQRLLALSFNAALAIFASAQTLLGFAALYGFRAERPGCMQLIRTARARLVSSLR